MLVSGLSADHHDEYFSIIFMLISSHYTAIYGRDPIWPDQSIIEHCPREITKYLQVHQSHGLCQDFPFSLGRFKEERLEFLLKGFALF